MGGDGRACVLIKPRRLSVVPSDPDEISTIKRNNVAKGEIALAWINYLLSTQGGAIPSPIHRRLYRQALAWNE